VNDAPSIVWNGISFAGWFVLAALAWLAGGARRPVRLRPVIGGAALVFGLGAVVFLVPVARSVLVAANDAVRAVLEAGRAGALFLFGPLALSPGETTASGEASVGFVLATQVLPAVVFFAAMMALLYRIGAVQPVIRLFARAFRSTTGLSGAESLGGTANLFVGVEAALTVRPFLARMTRSELLLLLTCGMSTVASTTLAIYVFLLADAFPLIAGHLLSASVLSVPTAAVVAKLMLPETGTPETLGAVPEDARATDRRAWLTVLGDGGMDGIRLAAGIAALLIAVLGLVRVLDLGLGWATAPVAEILGGPLTIERLLGWLFTPLAWCLGIEAADVAEAARVLGRRAVLTEVVAYQDLAALAGTAAVSPRTLLILSYALCGFAHVASVGVFVGGFAALAPERADDLGALGPRALVAATLATLMTGAVAGTFWTGAPGLLGL
jgi:CNT family concentrative nucleoside transporter